MGALVVQLKGDVSCVAAAPEEGTTVEAEWLEHPETAERDAKTTIA
jgi:hypothetical protein